MKKNAGFTLIELMIVVAIIAIIAAIAIPSLLRSRVQSNEAAAQGNLRAICGAEIAYHAANYAYTSTWADFTSATPPFLETDFSTAKAGYTYTLASADPQNNFSCSATPVSIGVSGNRGFFVDGSGVIRWNASGTATAADPPIGN